MVDFVSLLAVAQRLINANGRTVTLVQFDADPVDPSKPWQGSGDPRADPESTLDIKAVFVEPSSATRLGLSSVDSDLITRADQILIMAPDFNQDVTVFHEIYDGATQWKISGLEVLRPGNDTVLVFMGVAR